ncbi:MAG: L,D-transpeptidase [Thermoleophilia bacterium]
MRLARRQAIVAGAVVALGAPALAAGQAPAGLHVSAFTADPAITTGERAAISGRVAPAAVVPVAVERLEGDAWATIATVRTRADGRFAATLPLRRSGNLRVSVATAEGGVSTSRRRFVTVRRKVTLRVTAAPLENISGRPFTARGVVVGAAKGERAVLEGSLNGSRFRPLKRIAVKGGRVAATFTPPKGGTWRFRLTAEASADGSRAEGRATTGRMDVYGSNPHGIPSSAPHYLVQEISQFHLYYYEGGTLRRVFPVVFGAPGTPTPVGTYRVYSKTVGPRAAFGPLVLWYHRGYGIHGTNQEYLLDDPVRYYSHGCTRNYNANILWLWPRVPVGTPVRNLA